MITFKRKQLEQLAQYRNQLRLTPQLHWLFFEITSRCNLRCQHCGSSCTTHGDMLTIQDVKNTLRTVRGRKPMICLTGGEPLLHPDFYQIARTVKDMGFHWGMTSNATLIGAQEAKMIRRAGMSTISVSLDGLEETHDALRQTRGAWKRAIEGIRHLQDVGYTPQVTTVIHPGNIDQLDQLFDLLCHMGITSWRPINIEPIGRACESRDLLLSPGDFQRLIAFIRSKRFDPHCKMEVTFGCSHYLGVETERMARDHYFLCGAGITVASIRSNGDICACLDIENRPELVQGNIHTDDFMDIWLHRFQAFRRDRTQASTTCSTCPDRYICGGDSTHTWNFDQNEPLLCGLHMMNK